MQGRSTGEFGFHHIQAGEGFVVSRPDLGMVEHRPWELGWDSPTSLPDNIDPAHLRLDVIEHGSMSSYHTPGHHNTGISSNPEASGRIPIQCTTDGGTFPRMLDETLPSPATHPMDTDGVNRWTVSDVQLSDEHSWSSGLNFLSSEQDMGRPFFLQSEPESALILSNSDPSVSNSPPPSAVRTLVPRSPTGRIGRKSSMFCAY